MDEGFFVEGVDQWVRVRGDDRDNPILLYLHGGPGAATSFYSWYYFAALGWERSFTMAHWDQPGAGRTFIRGGRQIDPKLTLDRVAEIGCEVVEALRKRYGKRKLILCGGSWGTGIGLLMAHARPDLLYAYVGTAQVVDKAKDEARSYELAMSHARARGDAEALSALEKIGPPPYANATALGTQRGVVNRYERPPPLLTDREAFAKAGADRAELQDWQAAFFASDTHFRGAAMDGPWAHFDAYKIGRRYRLPMFFFQGADDLIAPAEHVKAFADWIHAPSKTYVAIEGGGHNIAIRDGRMLALLEQHVRPLAM